MADLQKTSAYGWLGPQTSSGGQLIFFYSSHPKAEWPIARIYENDWDKLPDWLIDEITAAEVDEVSSGAPKKGTAIAKGLLNFFDTEMNLYVYKDGNKITKTVAWEESAELQAGRPQQAMPAASSASNGGNGKLKLATQKPSDNVYLGFTEKDKELFELVEQETEFKFNRALAMAAGFFPEEESLSGEAYIELVKTILYENNRTFAPIRGASLVSAESLDPLAEAKEAILKGEVDAFMDDVASGHPVILDGEHARAVFEKIGITSFNTEQKESGEARVELASKAWMYVDLTSKYEITPSTAKKLVGEAYDEIPF